MTRFTIITQLNGYQVVPDAKGKWVRVEDVYSFLDTLGNFSCQTGEDARDLYCEVLRVLKKLNPKWRKS